MSKETNLYAAEPIKTLITTVRGQKVILDSDLARVYGVPTKRLNEQVRRNSQRFPQDFAFRLSAEEATILLRSRSQIATNSKPADMRSQIATASKRNVRFLPYAFTEHGAIYARVCEDARAVDQPGGTGEAIVTGGECPARTR